MMSQGCIQKAEGEGETQKTQNSKQKHPAWKNPVRRYEHSTW